MLAGVIIRLTRDGLGNSQLEAVSDQEGRYSFAGLIAADYLVSVELQGFQKYEKRLSVQIEATAEHNILLQPQPLSATVTVTDDNNLSL